MGSSFVESEKHGFWVSDGLLEIWLLSLAREIDTIAEPVAWLIEARQHWYIQATIGCMGCVSPDVDYFVTSEERRQELIKISQQTLSRLLEGNKEQDLKIEHWTGFGLHETTLNTFLSNLQEIGQINLIKVGKQFIKLLRGEVTSSVSSMESVSWMSE